MSTTTTALIRRTFGVFTITTLLFGACGVGADTTQVMLPFRRPPTATRPARI